MRFPALPLPATLAALLLALLLAACGGDAPEAPEAPAAESTAAAPTAPAAPAPGAKLNLNTATREEFLAVPGVTERMVHEFEEYRPYASIQQFRREIGKYVDEAQVAAYEQHVFVPVDPNASDAETLRQLPGVDESEAAELVAGRPYASREAFLEKLGGYVGADERAVAETYLQAP